MPRCELTQKGPVVKNLVSHSNIKTKSTAHPNIQSKFFMSETLGEKFRLKVAMSTLRTVEHKGSFDSFILKQEDESLSKRALKIKTRIRKKLRQSQA